ncbi:MAG TPA: DUF2946 family protein [Burkholderiales bacterium]|jgi:hypothetical protein|nr:DUF2946 family protein [Burkholderiales bacterium]
MPLYRNRVAALLAMIAMALSALWPLISQAKPRVPGAQVPVCTIEGITHYIELPATDTPVEQRSAAHHEHCKMCVFGGDRSAALPAAASPHLIGTVPAARIVAVRVAEHESPPYRPAQPRAPPVAS